MARPGDDQAVGGETESTETGAEQITPGKAPQSRPLPIDEAGEQGGGETLRRPRTISAGTTGDNLVQGAARQTAPRQRAIDLGQGQRHGLDVSPAGAELKGTDAGAKRVKGGVGGVPWHGDSLISVLLDEYLFLFCSNHARAQSQPWRAEGNPLCCPQQNKGA